MHGMHANRHWRIPRMHHSNSYSRPRSVMHGVQCGGVGAYGHQQRSLRRDRLRSPYGSRLGNQRHEQAWLIARFVIMSPSPPRNAASYYSGRDACRGDSSSDTQGADRGGWTVTAPPGPISKATAATWTPQLRAAAAGYGLVPYVDPSPLTRQVTTHIYVRRVRYAPGSAQCAINAVRRGHVLGCTSARGMPAGGICKGLTRAG